MKSIKIELTAEEAVLLDGKVPPDAQALVSLAIDRLRLKGEHPDVEHAWFVADLIAEAKEKKKLIKRSSNVSFCGLCKKSKTYAKRKRASRYHAKGSPNYDRPIYLVGYEFAERFVRIQGNPSLGCCKKCWGSIEDVAKIELQDIEAEIPPIIIGEDAKQYARHRNMHCKKCDWKGHEGEMKQLQALMSGYYPGGCPECKAENKPFGKTIIESIDGYTITEKL